MILRGWGIIGNYTDFYSSDTLRTDFFGKGQLKIISHPGILIFLWSLWPFPFFKFRVKMDLQTPFLFLSYFPIFPREPLPGVAAAVGAKGVAAACACAWIVWCGRRCGRGWIDCKPSAHNAHHWWSVGGVRPRSRCSEVTQAWMARGPSRGGSASLATPTASKCPPWMPPKR